MRYLNAKSVDELSSLVADASFQEQPFFRFSSLLKATGLAEYVVFDPTIVRGLDYYTGLVFEIFDKHPENRRAIAGGGAYANLLQIFNEQPVAGIGFGLGEVPLKDFLAVHKLTPDFSKQEIEVMVAYQDPEAEIASFEVSQKLRALDIKVELYLGEAKPKKIYTVTDKKSPTFLLLLGAQEISSGEVQLKNLKSKDIHSLKLADSEQMAALIKGSR
jgi:histidyl-tRNA synthetase